MRDSFFFGAVLIVPLHMIVKMNRARRDKMNTLTRKLLRKQGTASLKMSSKWIHINFVDETKAECRVYKENYSMIFIIQSCQCL